MQSVLVVVELFVSAGLIIVIMLQRSEGGALGMGGGGGGGLGGLFSPRGAADTLTRTTAILAVLFFVTCLALNMFALHGHVDKSILDTNAPATSQSAPKPAAPAKAPAPAVPTPH
jgi:preprotein translocase subunit SecG